MHWAPLAAANVVAGPPAATPLRVLVGARFACATTIRGARFAAPSRTGRSFDGERVPFTIRARVVLLAEPHMMKRRVMRSVTVPPPTLVGVRLVVGDDQARPVWIFLAAGGRHHGVVAAPMWRNMPPLEPFPVDAASGPGSVHAVCRHDPAARAGVRIRRLGHALGVDREQHEHGNDRARDRREPLVIQHALLDSVGAAALLLDSVGAAALLGRSHS